MGLGTGVGISYLSDGQGVLEELCTVFKRAKIYESVLRQKHAPRKTDNFTGQGPYVCMICGKESKSQVRI